MVRGRTAGDGWADFPALAFAEATVLVRAPGYARRRLGWRDGQKELTLELEPEAILTGEVRDTADRPARAFYVNVMSRGDQISASASPDGNGRFRITELPAGTWSVTVRDADGRSTLYQGSVTLEAGGTRELTIKAKKE
jgi:hypothetical protein